MKVLVSILAFFVGISMIPDDITHDPALPNIYTPEDMPDTASLNTAYGYLLVDYETAFNLLLEDYVERHSVSLARQGEFVINPDTLTVGRIYELRNEEGKWVKVLSDTYYAYLRQQRLKRETRLVELATLLTKIKAYDLKVVETVDK